MYTNPTFSCSLGRALSCSAAGRALSCSAAGRALSCSAAGRALSCSAAGRALSCSAAGRALSCSADSRALSCSAAGRASMGCCATLGCYHSRRSCQVSHANEVSILHNVQLVWGTAHGKNHCRVLVSAT